MIFLFQAPILRWTSLSSSRFFFLIIFRAAKVLVSANFLGSLLVIIRACSSKLALRHKLWVMDLSSPWCFLWVKSDVFHRGVLPGIKSVGWKFELYLYYLYIYSICIYIYHFYPCLGLVWDVDFNRERLKQPTLTKHSPKKKNKTSTQSNLVGGFNPVEKYWSKWESSPSRGENKKYLSCHHLVISKIHHS